jgi:hypothetical protein
MKDWIQDHYDDTLTSYDGLRKAIEEAWKAVPAEYFMELRKKMHKCCQAVIDVKGEHTRF